MSRRTGLSWRGEVWRGTGKTREVGKARGVRGRNGKAWLVGKARGVRAGLVKAGLVGKARRGRGRLVGVARLVLTWGGQGGRVGARWLGMAETGSGLAGAVGRCRPGAARAGKRGVVGWAREGKRQGWPVGSAGYAKGSGGADCRFGRGKRGRRRRGLVQARVVGSCCEGVGGDVGTGAGAGSRAGLGRRAEGQVCRPGLWCGDDAEGTSGHVVSVWRGTRRQGRTLCRGVGEASGVLAGGWHVTARQAQSVWEALERGERT